MKLALSLLVTTLLLVGCGKDDSLNTAQSITFKGVALFQPEAVRSLLEMCLKDENNYEFDYRPKEKTKNLERGMCDPKHISGFQMRTQYGNLDSKLFNFDFQGDGAVSHGFAIVYPYEVPALVLALTDKYGKPNLRSEEVKNAIGVKYKREFFQWIDKKGHQLTVTSITDRIDQGVIKFESVWFLNSRKDTENRDRANNASRL